LELFQYNKIINDIDEAIKLLHLNNRIMAVDKLNIQSLIPRIEEYLITNSYNKISQELLKQFIKMGLLDYCLDKICDEPEILFINLKAPMIELLLKRDDLYLEEIEIRDNLLKWAFAQTISLNGTKMMLQLCRELFIYMFL
jgi:hypothetical protein